MYSAPSVLMIILIIRIIWNIKNRMCPYRCANPTYVQIPKLAMRAINELKITCRNCKQNITLENIDNHVKSCMKPKCATPGCPILEVEMKHPIKVCFP